MDFEFYECSLCGMVLSSFNFLLLFATLENYDPMFVNLRVYIFIIFC